MSRFPTQLRSNFHYAKSEDLASMGEVGVYDDEGNEDDDDDDDDGAVLFAFARTRQG